MNEETKSRAQSHLDSSDVQGGKVRVRIIASHNNWVVSEAVSQLQSLARLPGVEHVVGLPDLHPGRGVPIGAAVITSGVIYPHLAGNAIGCGMALWKAGLPAGKRKLDRWTKKLKGLENCWGGDVANWLANDGVQPTSFDRSLGTIGGGNHFAELQAVEAVHDELAFEGLGLEAGELVLLVHSGSRGFGEAVLQDHLKECGTAGTPVESDPARTYLTRHNHAIAWARCNRTVIAHRFLSMISGKGERVLDLCHNGITQTAVDGKSCWVHRKGAAPSDVGPVVVPGSRGSLSYLVQPTGDQKANGFSVAHGAGRKWARNDARGRLEGRYSPESLKRTDLGSRVICEDKNLLYEEAPQAYKKADVVVQDLVDAGLVRIVATFRPLITYKTKART